MDVIVINLDADIERMAHMRAELAKMSLRYERFSALRGEDVPADLRCYFEPDAQLSPGEIGCYASHLAIMQRVANGALPSPLLVLEDDVGLPSNLAAVLDSIEAALPHGFDIVRLSYPTKRVTRPLAALRGGYDLVRYSHVPTSTGAYLITQAGARKFLDGQPRRLPIDHDLRRVWKWDLDTYGVSPPLVRPGVLGCSSIDTLSPEGRDTPRRVSARERLFRRERFARFCRGVRDFGLARWLALGALNLAARLTPRPLRPAYFRWANARLA